jgi:hypothetical protein
VAAVAVWAILRRPATRRRLEAGARQARERFETWRAQDLRPGTGSPDDGTASDADVLAIGTPTDGTGRLPQDEITTGAAMDGVPAFEESQTPGRAETR